MCITKDPLRYLLLIASIAWPILIVNACAQIPEYGLGFLNKTGHPLDEVSVYSDGKLWGLPTPLVVGSDATEDGLTMPIPTNAEVRIIEHGEHKSVMVSIKNVPRNFQQGTIYFVFNRDGSVQAKALEENDGAGYAELIKGLRPAGEYRFGFVNRTGHDIESVSVNEGTTQISRPNNGSSNIPVRTKFEYSDTLLPPIPSEVELRWNDEGTATHAAKVKLDGVPKGFEGRIFFVIKADETVEVHPVKNGDDKAAFKLVK